MDIIKYLSFQQHARLTHSIKTALACLLGFIVASFMHFRVDQWIIITTLVVMCGQPNVGGMMQKSYMRFLGTITGTVIAIATLFLFSDNNTANITAVILSAILFSFIATSNKSYSEAGTLGAVTVTIILIGQNPTLSSGLERFLEISLGILIAALVSQFILPLHAGNLLRCNQAETIRKLRTFYMAIFSNHLTGEAGELRNLDEEISKSLIIQRKLAAEAKREHFSKSFNLDFFEQSLWLEKEILRSIVFMYHAYYSTEESKKIILNINLLFDFHTQISESLEKIAFCIEKKRNEIIPLPRLEPIKNAINDSIQSADRIALDGFMFGLEILVSRLNKLVELIQY